MSKEIRIELKSWDYTCGDGCCYEWGTSCKIDGVEIDNIPFSNANDVANALQVVLTHLGYEPRINFYEDED
jgi:hypothetical protein